MELQYETLASGFSVLILVAAAVSIMVFLICDPNSLVYKKIVAVIVVTGLFAPIFSNWMSHYIIEAEKRNLIISQLKDEVEENLRNLNTDSVLNIDCRNEDQSKIETVIIGNISYDSIAATYESVYLPKCSALLRELLSLGRSLNSDYRFVEQNALQQGSQTPTMQYLICKYARNGQSIKIKLKDLSEKLNNEYCL